MDKVIHFMVYKKSQPYTSNTFVTKAIKEQWAVEIYILQHRDPLIKRLKVNKNCERWFLYLDW